MATASGCHNRKQQTAMIELLLISRFVADYAWDFKLLNILHTAIVAVIALYFIAKKLRTDLRFKAVDLAVVAFGGYTMFAFWNTQSDRAAFDFVKLMPCVAYYFIGRLCTSPPGFSRVSSFAALILIALSIAAVFGVGFIDWGGVRTYTGGYFFKTDAALAVLVFATFSMLWTTRRALLGVLLLAGAYTVVLTNARIAIPLLLVLPGLLYLSNKGLFARSGRAIALTAALTSASVLLFALLDLSSMNLLGLDLSDPFSDKNTQGRTAIWASLLEFYAAQGMQNKIFGAGLAADIVAASHFYQFEGFTESRAHNSFLWLLVCFGWAGGTLYMVMIAAFIKQAHRLALYSPNSKYLFVFASLMITFLAFSISTEAIVKPQITFPLFLFAGLCANTALRPMNTPNPRIPNHY